METLEVVFTDNTPGRLVCEAPGEPVTCQSLVDGSMKTPAEAGTMYLLLHPGTPEPPTVAAARAAEYALEVQYGTEVVIPVNDPLARRAAGHTPEPPTRRGAAPPLPEAEVHRPEPRPEPDEGPEPRPRRSS